MAEATTGDAIRNERGQFLRGHRNVGGRPRGARNLLSERFLSDLQRAWQKHGAKALDKVAAEAPETLVKVIAGLMPRELIALANVSVDVNLFADAKNFAEAFRLARRHIGADLPLIEAEHMENDDDDSPAA
jgi:hypothetical protein